MSATRLLRVLATVLAITLPATAVLSTAGCARDVDEPETPVVEQPADEPAEEPLPADDGSSEPTATPPAPQYVYVYFARDEHLGVSRREIPATKAVATAAMRELLLGPTGLETEYGLDTEIPFGTDLISVSITDRVATVDLSGDFEEGGGWVTMEMRLAQVVFTLTQFSTVDAVEFRLDGVPVDVFSSEGLVLDRPQTRADYDNVLPAVLVESPTPGETVSAPLRIKGMANAFEGTFLITIVDPTGVTIVDTFATAGAMGEWKAFDIQIPFTTDHTGIGSLIISIESAMDGSRTVVVELPIKMLRE